MREGEREGRGGEGAHIPLEKGVICFLIIIAKLLQYGCTLSLLMIPLVSSVCKMVSKSKEIKKEKKQQQKKR